MITELGIERETFSRTSRLLDKKAYQRVFSKAEKTSDRYFTILWRPSEKDIPRLGLAISKKHLRRAVDRNRVKRLVRESFRKQQKILPGIDIVVLAGRFIKQAENRQILDSLNRHWNSMQVPH